MADKKAAYPHVFVVLAAASATVAGQPGAAKLLAHALAVIDRRFREPESGLLRERWDRRWGSADGYQRRQQQHARGRKALLAASNATGDRALADQALQIASYLVNRTARQADWRIVEHFDDGWSPVWRYHEERPADPFRPFGATVGHGIEWSRLLIHLSAVGADAPDWLLPAARQLFRRAEQDGWMPDGPRDSCTRWTGRAPRW